MLPVVAPLRETVTLSFDSVRASKLRSGLTVLGVVIGVSVVMAMASIVQGIRDQIVKTIEIAGPTTFYVMKVISQTPLNPDRLPKWVRVRPDLTRDEAEALVRDLPGLGIVEWDAKVAALADHALVVNTTPLGMIGHSRSSMSSKVGAPESLASSVISGRPSVSMTVSSSPASSWTAVSPPGCTR